MTNEPSAPSRALTLNPGIPIGPPSCAGLLRDNRMISTLSTAAAPLRIGSLD